MSCGIVSGVDVLGPDGVGSSIPGCNKAGHSVLVEDVQDVKVEAKSKTSVSAKPVIMCPGKVRLRESRRSSHIAPFD